MHVLKIIYLLLGVVSLLLGLIGAFLPILPTVPFVLLSAYCFARGYAPLYIWLRDRSIFAESLQNWESERAISRKSKYKALLMIAVSFVLALYFAPSKLWLKIGLLLIGIVVTTFISTRPEPKSN